MGKKGRLWLWVGKTGRVICRKIREKWGMIKGGEKGRGLWVGKVGGFRLTVGKRGSVMGGKRGEL